ncbi:hypothetical protein [Bacillus sp. V59.32b]|uniref:hypothetical protein n=1 Tax=Bacillus sp. V59.32b TaxID=1758642 RepID=UPI000E3E8205|nr:hypothetical protein [Bacillus sp. V59.32b]RFU69625.1 hypothetical protein D0463_01990 [Bacillus sp. V59.32b]
MTIRWVCWTWITISSVTQTPLFSDYDGDGFSDPFDAINDIDGDFTNDANDPFIDTNGNHIHDGNDPFQDWDQDGLFDGGYMAYRKKLVTQFASLGSVSYE